MARRLRMFEAGAQYFITSRTFQGRFLMHPSPEIRELIGGLLARAARLYSIKVFGYVFMSNHFHLIIEGAPSSIPRFVGWLKREISVRVGQEREWSGSFWQRRYDAEKILDEAALLDRLAYIAKHGMKEGLVAQSTDWPGLHCIHQIGSDSDLVFELPAGKKKTRQVERLSLERLPQWKRLSPREYEEAVGLFKRDIGLTNERLIVDTKPLTLPDFLEKPFDHRPEPPESPPRPLCHTTSPVLRLLYAAKFRIFRERFAEASREYRAGNTDAQFPPGAFRPPLPPREEP